ncbi:hypothetical protein ANO11243_020750 [Dothideomycetidae sp. 11243]|nr:hypothetical protein ANO11243_020750 [fungal sp. No.11243]
MPSSSSSPTESPSSSSSTSTTTKSTEWDTSGERFKSKRNSEYLDPCQAAADRSLKCLRRNGGARDMCVDYFDAYRECKKAWQDRLREEKRATRGGWF